MRRTSTRSPSATRLGFALIAILAVSVAEAQQGPIVSSQQVTPPAGQRFSTLPGFVVERVTPEAGPTYAEPLNPLTPAQAPIGPTNLIIITFDEQGRPWVSPSASMRGSARPHSWKLGLSPLCIWRPVSASRSAAGW